MTDIETGPSQCYIDDAIEQAAVTLQWQASDATEVGNGYPIGECGDEYTDEIIAKVPYLTEAVTAFITDEENWRLLRIAESSASQTGHDFILTANGHGAGFWDRGYDSDARPDQPGRSVGRALTDNCKPYGSFDAEFALWGDYADDDNHCADEVAYLCVMNEIIVDDGMISQYDHDTRGE
jgi:hypothetical protein